ncbi:phage antirepressor KilAC domain-containing protein [Elizabethkingia anophelis]|nr:phage antirepressor KilAC domain-containing protein [Elizabethkingia anophelis]
MNELIKIQDNGGQSAVSARELHKFLEIETRFNDWIKRMFEYGFTQDTDYQLLLKNEYNLNGGRPETDYALTLDCAKEISMLQRSEKGKQARKYFIDCEKKLKTGGFALPQTFAEALKLAANQAERIELQSIELRKQAPKVEYFNEVLQSESVYNTNQIAKELGMSAVTLNRKLSDMKIQYKQSGTWLLYHVYQNKGFTKTKTHTYTDTEGKTQTSMQTVWTEKGRAFIHYTIKKLQSA